MRERAPAQSNLARHSSSRLDLFASDIETRKRVSASLGSYVNPAYEPKSLSQEMADQVRHDAIFGTGVFKYIIP